MTATLPAVFEYCPQARRPCAMEDGQCGFCSTDHKLMSQLPARTRKVLRLLADGYALKAAAGHMHIDYNTCSSVVRDARLMTGARTTEQLMAMLGREGSL